MKSERKEYKRKIIDIPEDVFRILSVKAATEGTNLKHYIEQLIIRDASDLDNVKEYLNMEDK